MLLEEGLAVIEGGGEAVLGRDDLADCLRRGPSVDEPLFRAASAVLSRTVGPWVFVRGIVEMTNACRKNCYYCGLRSDHSALPRYSMPFEEIAAAIESGWAAGLRSFLLQSGELLGEPHIALVEKVLRWADESWGDSVRMVLSTGELPRAALERLKAAGGGRYLLRIETSDPVLYAKLHPRDGLHRFEERIQCLRNLRKGGWQAGSGVLIGVPWQTEESLAGDLLFLRDFGIDMCGMGPWIEHSGTPLYASRHEAPSRERRVSLTLRMIALLRILMPDINMSATTALQTLTPTGLERGLAAGANVFMPNLTPTRYRLDYNLYEGKTVVPDRIEDVLDRMSARCAAMGRTVVPGEVGDPLHFTKAPPVYSPPGEEGVGDHDDQVH